MKKISILITALSLAIPLAVYADWVRISLEEFVQKNPLVVVGEVQRVAEAPKSPRAFDTAFIKVERILKNSVKESALKVNEEIPLSMPSPRNELKISSDIHYKKGDRGIWILRHENGKFHGGHPMSLQPLAAEPNVIKAIEGKKSQ